MKININKHTRVMCVLPKYSFGDKNREYSTEYQSFYYSLKKKFKKFYYFNSLKPRNSRDALNSSLLKECEKFKPDCIFFSIAFNEIYIETLIKIKKKNRVLLLNWCSDDSWRYKEHTRFFSNYFDYMVTTDLDVHKKYKESGVKSILTSWGCPDYLIQKPKKSIDCKFDVIFIGSSYFGRKEAINYLRKKNIKIHCYGYGWENKPIKIKDLGLKMNNSKIAINFSRSRKNVMQTKARVFEATGCGSLCISEKSKDLRSFFKPNEIIDYNDLLNLEKKINYYLKYSKQRDLIANNGYKKCKKKFTYSKILNKIFLSAKFKNSRLDLKPSLFIDTKKKELYFIIVKTLNFILLKILSNLFNKDKASKVLRRLIFELEWRIRGMKTYTKSGWVNRIY
jgi:spore maturation protein CgeB